jgi:hypothetical protein
VPAERVHLRVDQPALGEAGDGQRASAYGDRGGLGDRVVQVEPQVAAAAQQVAERAAAGLAFAVREVEHDVAVPVEAGRGHRPVQVVLAEDLVAGRDRDRAGGLGVHPERAGRQARRVDPAEPPGREGDRDDLLPTVECHRVQGEPHPGGRRGGGAGKGQSRGGARTGGEQGSTAGHEASYVSMTLNVT